MKEASVYIVVMGVISVLGCGAATAIQAVEIIQKALQSLVLFPVSASRFLRAGMVMRAQYAGARRRRPLACKAAEQALAEAGRPPADAIEAGSTAVRFFAQ